MLLSLLLAAGPVAADEGDLERGTDLLEEGARLLLRGLLAEVEPAMRDLAETLEDFDFEGFSIDDLSKYHPPEVLPNGDILIRRKTPLNPEIDL